MAASVSVGSGVAASSSPVDSSGAGEDSVGDGLGRALGDSERRGSARSPRTSLRDVASWSRVRPALKACARTVTRPGAASSSKPIR